MKLEEDDAGCIPSVEEMGNMTNLSWGCDTDRVKVLQLPHHLLRSNRARSLVRLLQAASLLLYLSKIDGCSRPEQPISISQEIILHLDRCVTSDGDAHSGVGCFHIWTGQDSEGPSGRHS